MHTSLPMHRIAGLAGLLLLLSAPQTRAQTQPSPPAAASASDVAAGRIQAMETENRYLRGRIRELESELDAVEPAEPAQPERLSELERENRQLSAKVDLLQEHLDVAARERATLRRMEEQARQWREIILEQRTRLAGLQRRLDAHSELSGEVEELRTHNRQLELALKGSEQEAGVIDRLQEDVRVAQAKLRVLLQERNQSGGEMQSLRRRADALSDDLRREREARTAAEQEWTALQERSGALTEQLEALQIRAQAADLELESLRRAHAQDQVRGTEDEGALREAAEEMDSLRQSLIAAQRRAARAEQLHLEGTEAQAPLEVETALAEQARRHQQELDRVRADHDAALSGVAARYEVQIDSLRQELQALREELETNASRRYLDEIVPR